MDVKVYRNIHVYPFMQKTLCEPLNPEMLKWKLLLDISASEQASVAWCRDSELMSGEVASSSKSAPTSDDYGSFICHFIYLFSIMDGLMRIV